MTDQATRRPLAIATGFVRRHPLAFMLASIVVVVAVLSLTAADLGAFVATYLATALVAFGAIELARRMRNSRPLGAALAILAAGVVAAAFASVGITLSAGVYIGLLIGNTLTVITVLALARFTRDRTTD